MTKYLSLLIIMLIVFTSCKDNSTNPTNPTNKDIFPLKIGNTWFYTTQEYDSTGQITKVTIDSLSISKDTTINNEVWHKFESNGSNGNSPYVTLRSDGFYAMQEDSNKNLVAYRVYKYPASTGEVFVRNNPFKQDTIKVLSTSSSVTTPAGTFSCYAYQSVTEQIIYGYYFYYRNVDYISPAVGMIKTEFYEKKSDGTEYLSSSMALKSYVLK